MSQTRNEKAGRGSGGQPAARVPAGARGRLVCVMAPLLGAGLASWVLASPAPATQPRTIAGAQAPVQSASRQAAFAVGLRVLRLIDTTRSVRLRNGRTAPRTLLTYLRYPAEGRPWQTDLANAPPDRASGPFPLIVFAHGFDVTPALYAHLLQRWTRAGYLVAAPVFPLESAGAPGGPDRSDLIHQPQDVSFVISRILAATKAPSGALTGLADPAAVAVAGHSDGGETALATAYSRSFRDPRIGAAVILAGARMSGAGGFTFGAGAPPLLAAQGTDDTTNEPRFTDAFFAPARQPKFLLRLLGAEHLAPFTSEQPQLAILERVSIAFLDGYLKRSSGSLQELVSLGNQPETSTLLADP